jgi:Fe/S biogenesis protein NfuA
MITITEPAQEYLAGLLSNQDDEVLGIRIFVNQPGTPQAEPCINYCRTEDVQADDTKTAFTGFDAYFDNRSLLFLEDAVVDYTKEQMDGQLTIKAPNSKILNVSDDSPIEDRINYVLYNEINPALASHGGKVSLVEVAEESVAVLQFGGGCQGCGMVDATLKDGVERTLLEQIPGLTAVRDVTDHSNRSQAYF